jgi:PAS domain S-box-containing protein
MVCRDNSGIERAGLVAAVEQAADAIVITDVDGTVQYANPAFTALTGYSREEAVGQNPRFLKSGQTPQEVYQELWSTIVAGRVWHGEVINRRKNGTVYREEMQITPVEGAAGQIVSFIAVKRDVTQVRAERDAQAFLATIVQSSEDAIVAYSPAGTILTWNRGAETVFGYSAAEAIGKPMAMLVPPDRQHALAAATERVRGANSYRIMKAWACTGTGGESRYWASGSPVRNAAGELIAISMILTRRQRSQGSGTGSRPAGVHRGILGRRHISVTLDGTIVSWNRGAEALCGYQSREMLGKNVALLAADERVEKVAGHLAVVRQGGTSQRLRHGPADEGRTPEVDVSLSLADSRFVRRSRGRFRHRPRCGQTRAGGAKASRERRAISRGL